MNSVVDRLEHWQTWKMPNHLVRLDDSGTVQVRDFRSVYNLLDDRSFRRQVDISSDKTSSDESGQHSIR